MKFASPRSSFAALSVLVATHATLVSRPALAQEPAAGGAEPAASAPTAGSQPSEAAIQEAGQRYDRGLKMYAEGDYSLAVIEFERAYELVPDYRVLYNIGQVRIQLAHYARARRALTQYLKEGGDRVSAERMKAVEADLDMLATRTGFLTIDVNVPGAEIFVDDVVVGQSPLAEPLLLDAGEHRLSARKPGFHPRASQVTIAGRDELRVKLDLEKMQTAAERIIVQQRAEESNREALMWGSWTACGVFAIVSGVTGGLGIKAASDLDDKRSEPGASRSELDSSSRRARTLLLTADVFGGLAIAAGGLGLYFTLSGDSTEPGKEAPKAPGKNPANKVGFAVAPGFVSVSGTY